MTIFGPEIAVDGRPAWLGDEMRGKVAAILYDGEEQAAKEDDEPFRYWVWNHIQAIRLPADHFAYLAIDKGFEPWGGGNAAPVDWDGGECLLRDGIAARTVSWWHHNKEPEDIIGYRKRQPVAEPDTITLPRMTEEEAREFAGTLGTWGLDSDSTDIVVKTLTRLNLIRPESRAERFTRETGIEVTGDVLRALEWDR